MKYAGSSAAEHRTLNSPLVQAGDKPKRNGDRGSKPCRLSNRGDSIVKRRHHVNRVEVVGSNPAPRKFPFWRTFRPYFEWRKALGKPECPYLHRWVAGLGLFSIRLHHWHSSDDTRHFHDHPWWFLTLVIKGSYHDVNPTGVKDMARWSVAYRPALHRHTVEVANGGCWTLLLTGPEIRFWGFWVDGKKFKKANKYFLEHGHHPCASSKA